nr:hypothetical protein [Sphaerochaetaceae bacterium]
MVYLEGTREECNAYLKKLALSKGTAHCFLDDKVVPELSAMDNIIMVTESINKGNILRAVK